jgi:hypothetical protein
MAKLMTLITASGMFPWYRTFASDQSTAEKTFNAAWNRQSARKNLHIASARRARADTGPPKFQNECRAVSAAGSVARPWSETDRRGTK